MQWNSENDGKNMFAQDWRTNRVRSDKAVKRERAKYKKRVSL